jgi:hypothetical protein
MTTATMGTGTDLASACTSVVAVADGVVTVATLAVTIDKPRGPAFCRPSLCVPGMVLMLEVQVLCGPGEGNREPKATASP